MVEYDLNTFKQSLADMNIRYTPELEIFLENFILPMSKNFVLGYCNRTEEEFIEPLKLIALKEASRRFLLHLINKGAYIPSGRQEEEISDVQSVKMGDTQVTYGTRNKQSSKEIIISFKAELENELNIIKKELEIYRNWGGHNGKSETSLRAVIYRNTDCNF